MADSGALIGLSRADLEQSLETLEMMAGDIGASVIVVKEIEVPPAMVALADKVSAYIDPETGAWSEKMVNRKRRASPRDVDSDSVAAFSSTDTDTTDFTDTDEALSLIATPNFPPQLGTSIHQPVAYLHRFAVSNPDRPTAQSSPSIVPIDDGLALFSMEPEPPLCDDDDLATEGATLNILADDVPELSLDIEITPVYKPRPTRRPSDTKAAGGEVGRPARRTQKNKDRRPPQVWQGQCSQPPIELDVGRVAPVPNKQEAKAALRRLARDRRREERRKAFLVPGPVIDGTQDSALQNDVPASVLGAPDQQTVVADLETLHAGVQSVGVAVVAEDVHGPTGSSTAQVVESKEPRLIVEALVVRKMSLEDEFLDFGNLGALSLS